MMTEPQITDERIAEVALEVLREQADPLSPQYLAAVGNRISSLIGTPLRQVLQGRKLRTILEAVVRNKVIFEGTPSEVKVRLASAPIADTQPIRFNSVFWAAFSKAIPLARKRWLRLTGYISFEDRLEEAEPMSGELEVGAEYIAPHSLSRSERDVAIVEQIKRWCAANNLQPEAFRQTAQLESTAPISPIINPGQDAIIRMIEAIPELERSRYSLPLDLLHRLLKSG
jgi:hypothetical protein